MGGFRGDCVSGGGRVPGGSREGRGWMYTYAPSKGQLLRCARAALGHYYPAMPAHASDIRRTNIPSIIIPFKVTEHEECCTAGTRRESGRTREMACSILIAGPGCARTKPAFRHSTTVHGVPRPPLAPPTLVARDLLPLADADGDEKRMPSFETWRGGRTTTRAARGGNLHLARDSRDLCECIRMRVKVPRPPLTSPRTTAPYLVDIQCVARMQGHEQRRTEWRLQ